MKSNETQGSEPLELTGKQANVLALLVTGVSIESAARKEKTNPSTVHAWMKKPEFRDRYNDALNDVIAHSSSQLKAACAVAVTVLREVAEDGATTSASRVSAARSILELAYRAREQDEVIARIEALEGLTP